MHFHLKNEASRPLISDWQEAVKIHPAYSHFKQVWNCTHNYFASDLIQRVWKCI